MHLSRPRRGDRRKQLHACSPYPNKSDSIWLAKLSSPSCRREATLAERAPVPEPFIWHRVGIEGTRGIEWGRMKGTRSMPTRSARAKTSGDKGGRGRWSPD